MKNRFFLFFAIFIFLQPLVHAQLPDVDVSARIISVDGGYTAAVVYKIPDGFHQTLQPAFFGFELISPDGARLGPISYPEGKTEDGLVNYYGTVELTAPVSGLDSPEAVILAKWQLCDENGMCLMPQSRELEAEVAALVPAEKKGAGGMSLLVILLLAAAGGLLLNIMPCVLPVLSIKALSLAKQAGDDRRTIFMSSLLYAAGVITSLLVLAAVIIAIKASGEQVGWGFQFQNKGFILTLITIVFLFSLSLFDIFLIKAPVLKTGGGIRRGNSASHFFSGILAVLLATPCSAPFLGTAAGFAFSQSPAVIAAVFAAIGLGLAFPFLVLGAFPGAIKRLPKPGPWMDVFRQVMGFLLLATVLWLLDVLAYQTGPSYLIRVLIYLFITSFAAWIYGRLSAPGRNRKSGLAGLFSAALIIAVSALFLLPFDSGAAKDAEKTEISVGGYEDWAEFSPESVLSAVGREQPVFLSFSARWCLTCRTNENTVIFTDEIRSFFRENDVLLFHGDYTAGNPEISQWMADHGRGGVPFYAWYPAGSDRPVILPEILTASAITDLVFLSADNR